MANINELSTGDLEKLIDQVKKLPDALRQAVYSKGLDKGGEIIKEYVEGSIAAEGLIDTGQMLESIKVQKHDAYVEVLPTGTRDRTYKEGVSGGKKSRYRTGSRVRNAEVAFVQEYGTKKQPGTKFMSKAADGSVDDVTEAMATILDEVLEQIF